MDLYKNYSLKSHKEINELLKSSKTLTLEAKLTLKKIVTENFNIEDFDQANIDVLNDLINENLKKIKNLNYLHWLGIELVEEPNNLTVKKSKSAKNRDFLGVFLGVFLGLFFFYSLYYWVDIIKHGLEIFTFAVSVTLTGIGIYGFVLLVKVFNRIMDYKGFMLLKNKDGLILNHRPNLTLEIKQFSNEAIVSMSEDVNIIEILINDKSKFTKVLSYKNLDYIKIETLKHLIKIINNRN